MERYKGNSNVGPGLYLSPRNLRVTALEEDARLPGPPAASWYRVPRVALLAVAPIIGLVFAIFLPLIGIAAVIWIALELTATALAPTVEAAKRVTRPAWQPALAFLGRGRRVRRHADEEERQPSRDEWAEEIEEELKDHE